MKQNNGLTNVNTNLIDLNIFVIYKKLKYVFVKQVFFFFFGWETCETSSLWYVFLSLSVTYYTFFIVLLLTGMNLSLSKKLLRIFLEKNWTVQM